MTRVGKKTHVRTARFEVTNIQGDKQAVRKRWHAIADRLQQAANMVWQQWEVWHVDNDSAGKLRKHLELDRQWRAGGKKGKRPKWPVQQMPPDLRKIIYRRLRDEFPDIGSRPLCLLENSIARTINTRKSSNGNLPGWVAVLFCREGRPSFTHALPIRFDCCNAKLRPPMKEGENWSLLFRLDRYEEGGKGKSNLDTVDLFTKSKSASKQMPILNRIGTGEYKFCGSSLNYCPKNRKWFVMLSWSKPRESGDATGDKTLIIKPGKKTPWLVRNCPGYTSKRFAGRGNAIIFQRRALLFGRWSRQEMYRHAGNGNKGHGRERALKPLWPLIQRWKNFVRTSNQCLAASVLRHCRTTGVGKVIYCQPEQTSGLFVANAGKVEDRTDSTGWDFHQFATCLANALEGSGIELVVRKGREAASVAA